jgi:hypothetical protein
VASLLALTLIVVAFAAAARRRTGVLPLVAVVLPFVFAFAQLVAVDWLEYSHSGALSGLQGRYFYLALVGLAPLVSLGAAAAWPGGADRWLPGLVLLGAVALHAKTVTAVLATHWNGAHDGLRAAAASATAWSALPAVLVRGTWLAAAALAAALAILLALAAARRSDFSD